LKAVGNSHGQSQNGKRTINGPLELTSAPQLISHTQQLPMARTAHTTYTQCSHRYRSSASASTRLDAPIPTGARCVSGCWWLRFGLGWGFSFGFGLGLSEWHATRGTGPLAQGPRTQAPGENRILWLPLNAWDCLWPHRRRENGPQLICTGVASH